MKSKMLCKALILVGFFLLVVSVCGDSSESERWVLSELKRGVSDPGGILSSWDASDLLRHHCSWRGVSCDSNSRVVVLRLPRPLVEERGNDSGALVCSLPRRFRRVRVGGFGKLSGRISPLVGKLGELRVLSLPYCDLFGEIPEEIWGLENLEVLHLDGNSLTGKLPVRFSGLSRLRVLNLGFNKLRGEIPKELFQSRDLRILNLAGNELSGPIPAPFGSGCERLMHLDLSRNSFSGRIPVSLGNCDRLRSLGLYSNHLTGEIPPSLGRLLHLKVLDVSGNRLRGPIPGELGSCARLSELVLSSGDSGEENRFEGSFPPEIATLPRLTILWAPSAGLCGNLPANWGPCESLETANLSRNLLEGELSGAFDRCPKLTRLDLTGNNPAGRVRVLAEDSSPPPPNGYQSAQANGGLNSIEVASVASASAIVVVLLALIVLFFYTRKWVPDSRVQGLEPREITVFSHAGAPLTFESIVRSTGNFSASNCIGNGGFGSTFKSELRPGVAVAVKRLSVGRFQQGIQQFHAEVKTLGRVRHPNLVTLLGYHASEAEMFLIYNYLPGGNLERFIKERSDRATDWRTLHKIALDIANALAYLHDSCVPRVLHRDVKPSNILLDEDLNAYLSDFGLSRLLGTSETHATTGVAGTFGYLAPEYAMTCRVSDKSDVYSYGVVLLELVSDKRPLDPSFSSYGDGFNIVSWAGMLLRQGRGKEVFTAGLWEAGPHDDLVEMLHLAITCTDETLSTRPAMKNVVHRLKRIKPVGGLLGS